MDSGLVYNIYLKGHVSSSDHNNLFTNDVSFARWNGKQYSDMAGYTKVSKMDSHSVTVNPFYKSSSDLHVSHPALHDAGIVVPGVTTDIDGEARTTIPDIGADEFQIGKDDASIVAIVEPPISACEGPRTLKVVIGNLGSNALQSATVGWSLNGTTQTGTSWTGNLSTKETDTITLGALNLNPKFSPDIAVWTSAPNGTTDGFAPNDTLKRKVTVNPLPFAFGGYDKKICLGDSVQLGIGKVNNREYQWTDTADNVLTTKARFYVQPSVNKKYVLRLTNTLTNCYNYDTVQVSVFNYPAVDPGQDMVLCLGDSIQLGTTAVAADDYSWTSRPPNFISTTAEPTVQPTTTTTYILTQKVRGTKCASTDSVVITVSPVPTAGITGATEACHNGIAVYKANAKGNAYNWLISGGATIDGAGTDSITVNWSSFGSGSVKLVESNTYCSDSITFDVTVHENPEAVIATEGNCAGREITFTDISGVIDSRMWDFGDGNTSPKKKATNIFGTAGEYKVVLEVTTDKGCKDTAQLQFTTVAIPAVDFGIPNTTCALEEIAFTNTTTGADAYEWSFGDDNTSTDENGTHTYAEEGLYKVQLLGDKDGCRDSITQSVIVDPLPDASFTAEADWYNVKVTPTATDGSKYAWDFGDGETSIEQETTHTYDIPDTKEMTITLTVTSKDGCAATTTQQVTVVGTSIEDRLPAGVQAIATYPNPFEHSTRIEMMLDKKMDVSVTLYDIRGRALSTLFNAEATAGVLQIEVDGTSERLVSGTYLVRIVLNDTHTIRQVIEMK